MRFAQAEPIPTSIVALLLVGSSSAADGA